MLNYHYMLQLVPYLIGYIPLTLEIAVASMFFALILAILIAVIRVLRIPVLNQLTLVFVSFFRGTPILVQLFLFYYGLPQLFSSLTSINGIEAAILGLSLNYAAYMSESIRAAITGVERSQTDAALSIGMTQSQLMCRIVLPQAFRVAVPTLVNYFIDVIKSTSLAFTLGVTELMSAAQKEAASNFLYFETFLTVAIIYWIMVEILSFAQRWLEHKLNHAYSH